MLGPTLKARMQFNQYNLQVLWPQPDMSILPNFFGESQTEGLALWQKQKENGWVILSRQQGNKHC